MTPSERSEISKSVKSTLMAVNFYSHTAPISHSATEINHNDLPSVGRTAAEDGGNSP